MTRMSETTLRRLAGPVVVLSWTGTFLVLSSLPVTALVMLRRQPRNRIAWLLMATAAVWAVGLAAESDARVGLSLAPGSAPRPDVAAALNATVWAPGLGVMGTFLILLFPDGRPPSPRWRPVAWLSGATIISLSETLALSSGRLESGPAPALRNPLAWESARPVLGPLLSLLLVLFPLVMPASAAALAVRFRRSTGTERPQLKWLAAVGVAVACLYGVSLLVPLVSGAITSDAGEPQWLTALDSLTFVSFMLLPAAIGVAVLRHRLYDVDVVINRTLVYTGLTATLAATYVGTVLLLQLVLNPLAPTSDLAVAVSALAVAALFQPLRRRIQAVVDRRFYRSRYDAALTVGELASRLRHELDLDALHSDLRSTVDKAVHPAHVSLWIRR